MTKHINIKGEGVCIEILLVSQRQKMIDFLLLYNIIRNLNLTFNLGLGSYNRFLEYCLILGNLSISFKYTTHLLRSLKIMSSSIQVVLFWWLTIWMMLKVYNLNRLWMLILFFFKAINTWPLHLRVQLIFIIFRIWKLNFFPKTKEISWDTLTFISGNSENRLSKCAQSNIPLSIWKAKMAN